MPTYEPEFALGQPVLLYLDGQPCHTTITRRFWDADIEDWIYQVSGLAGCDIPAYEIHAI